MSSDQAQICVPAMRSLAPGGIHRHPGLLGLRPAPAFDLEPSVSVAPCLHTGYYPVHAEMRENDLKLYREWRAKTSAPLFLWVYYHERGIEDWQERSHACRK